MSLLNEYLRDALKLAHGFLRLNTCDVCDRFATWYHLYGRNVEPDGFWCEDHYDKSVTARTRDQIPANHRLHDADDILAYEKILEQLHEIERTRPENS